MIHHELRQKIHQKIPLKLQTAFQIDFTERMHFVMHVIDSHTEGEPTRLIIKGAPNLGGGSVADQLKCFARDFDPIRRTAILEPRGSDILVGALLCEPKDSCCVAAVIFFNNVGFLGMCGHGMMGVAVSLAHLGRLNQGMHRFETPVGIVGVELENANTITIENVPSRCYRQNVDVQITKDDIVTGDIAWGGNWFFLIDKTPCDVLASNVQKLSARAQQIKKALRAQGIVGEGGAQIDHIEFSGLPISQKAQSRNFVLCPGNVYDRSPCGTGTSAKLACLAASNQLKPGEKWIQEGIVGGRFEASYQWGLEGEIIPRIRGRAFVYSEAKLLQHPQDPFREGILLSS